MIFWSVIVIILAIILGVWWWYHEPENGKDEEAVKDAKEPDEK